MVVAVDAALMLVVTVGSTKHCGANRARKVFNVIFAIQRSDVGAPERLVAFVAEQVESLEVVSLAEGVLSRRLVGHGEEFGGYNLAAVLVECQFGEVGRRT